MRDINGLIGLLMNQQVFRDWNLAIESNPIDLRNQTILPEPQIFKQNQVIHINENVMRRLPIQKAVNLGHEEWVMCYMDPRGNSNRRSNYNAANNVYDGLLESARELNITLGDPHWIELDNEADMEEMEEEIQHYMTGKGAFRFPKMLVLVLGNESLYEKHKQLLKLY